jgi:hypothetical protein
MGKINKTAAATAIAVSLATFIAMTGSEAAETPAPQRGYCLLHNHGGADCSFRSKAQCEATAFDQGAECYQDDGEVYLMAMRRPLYNGELEVRKSRCFDRVLSRRPLGEAAGEAESNPPIDPI